MEQQKLFFFFFFQNLRKLRNAAKDLGLPNHMSINWSMFTSATSDSTSTQAKFNKLIEIHKEEDNKKFVQCTGGMELITNFCAMHVGANLRKILSVVFINYLNLIRVMLTGKGNTIKQIILFMNLLSYSVNMVYQNTVWESYS